MAEVRIKGSVGKGGKNAAGDVEKTQKLLNLHKSSGGYAALSVDGAFGPKTLAAIKAFQKSAGLKVDGVVAPGKKTIEALNQKPGAAGGGTGGTGASKAGATGKAGAEEDEEKDALLGIEDIRKLLKQIAKANKRYIFAFALGGKPEQCVLYLKRKGNAKKISMFLKKETGLKKVAFGIICPDVDRKDMLVFELQCKQLPGLAKKGKKYLKFNKLLPFKELKLMVDGQEVADQPDDDEDDATSDGARVAIKSASEERPASSKSSAASADPLADPEYVTEDRSWSPKEELAVGEAEKLFTEGYMDKIMADTPKGSDSPKLNEAMEKLMEKPSGKDAAKYLKIVASETGMSEGQAKAQFKKFLAIRQQAIAAANKNPDLDPPPDVMTLLHGDFLGSTASLRYGKMVGDHFGIHAVFGALLNPTGGMVGPGNLELYDPDDPDNPIVQHGIAHDAAGYLKNYHGDGPGYDYLGEESQRDPTDPFVGQQSGIQYWLDKEGKDDLSTDMVRKGTDAWGWGLDKKAEVNKEYEATKKKLKQKGAEAYDWASESAAEAEEALGEAWDTLGAELEEQQREIDEAAAEAAKVVEEAAREVEEAIIENAEEAAEAVEEAARDAEEAIIESAEEAAEAVEEAARNAEDAIVERAEKAAEAIEEAARAAESAAQDAYDKAGEAVDDVERAASEAYDYAADAAEEAAEAAAREAEEAAEVVSDTASNVYDTMADTAESVWKAAGDAYDTASKAVSDAADYLESLW